MRTRLMRFSLRWLGLSLALGALVLLADGCTVNRAPMFEYNELGQKVQFQRIARNNYWDIDGSWRLTPWAYKKNTKKLHWLLSNDQKDVIGLLGQPDYIRKPFYSRTNERVHEWVWWEKQKVVQFVNRDVVFVGPLTDRERVLIRRGYPNDYIHQDIYAGIRETYIYSNEFEMRRHVYNFQNGALIEYTYLGN